MNILKNEIIKYISIGISIVPISGKIPPKGLEWKKYQTQLPTEKEINDWFNNYTNITGIALITGRLSGIIVVDCDIKNPKTRCDQSIINKLKSEGHIESQTGSGGSHFFVKYNPLLNFTNNSNVLSGLDIKSDGGMATLPPSTAFYGQDELEYAQYNGTEYKWVKEYDNNKLKPFPSWLLEKIDKERPLQKSSQWKEAMGKPILQGNRNNDFVSIIGGLLTKFPIDEWEKYVWANVVSINKAQEKPLPEQELRIKFEALCKKESQKRQQIGEIQDINTEIDDENLKINVILDEAIICFSIKNMITSLLEANILTWIKRANGLSHEIPFYLKLKSDSNKEQWVRILKSAFDTKETKYPWTIITAKVSGIIETHIKSIKQDFVATEIEEKEPTWLLEPFIQENQINTIFGLGSSGKTLLSLFFAKIACLEMDKKVLFIDYEDCASSWKAKLRKIQNITEIPVGLDRFIYFASEQIPVAEQIEKVKESIKRHNVGLVIVDSASLATGDSTSDEKSAVRLVSALKLLKTTILLIAHQRKNDGDKTPIGSIQYENQSRNVWNVKSTPDDQVNTVLHIALSHTKANNTYLRKNPVGYKIEYTPETISITLESAMNYFEEKYNAKQRISDLLKHEGECTYKEISDALGLSKQSTAKNLTEGKKNGLFENTEDGKWRLKTEEIDVKSMDL